MHAIVWVRCRYNNKAVCDILNYIFVERIFKYRVVHIIWTDLYQYIDTFQSNPTLVSTIPYPPCSPNCKPLSNRIVSKQQNIRVPADKKHKYRYINHAQSSRWCARAQNARTLAHTRTHARNSSRSHIVCKFHRRRRRHARTHKHTLTKPTTALAHWALALEFCVCTVLHINMLRGIYAWNFALSVCAPVHTADMQTLCSHTGGARLLVKTRRQRDDDGDDDDDPLRTRRRRRRRRQSRTRSVCVSCAVPAAQFAVVRRPVRFGFLLLVRVSRPCVLSISCRCCPCAARTQHHPHQCWPRHALSDRFRYLYVVH